MKTGRPRKLNNPVTVTVMMEDKARKELDELRSKHSRGKYISILISSDNLKTRKILDCQDQILKLEQKIEELSKAQDSDMKNVFRKTIYSNLHRYAIDFIDNELSHPAKKMWCEKLAINANKLKDVLW